MWIEKISVSADSSLRKFFYKKMLTDKPDSCNIIQVAEREHRKRNAASLDWQGIVSDCFRVLTKKKISKSS